MKMQLDKRNGVTTGGNDKDVADNADGNSGKDNGKTRKKSDKNMDNYRKIVIADDSEVEQRYKSDYRGRVQDRNVTIKLEPMYALTYYEKLRRRKTYRALSQVYRRRLNSPPNCSPNRCASPIWSRL